MPLRAAVPLLGNAVLPKTLRTTSEYFNTSMITAPSFGSIGNAGKVVFRGPGINNFDMAALKNFHPGERVAAQFRAEFYNAFNHVNYLMNQSGAKNTTAQYSWGQPFLGAPFQWMQTNPNFGTVTGSRSPRVIQLALRLSF